MGVDNIWYQAHMTPKPDSGQPVAAKGTGDMANIPVQNKDPHAGEESLGDAAARLKKEKAAKAAPATPAKSDSKPSYKTGTDRVPNTGAAVIHKDEAVLKKSDADKYRTYGLAADHLSGDKARPKKEVKEIRTRKAKSGGYIHEHHHTSPSDYPMEEHATPDQDAMASHMIEHMGEANPGEAEADAGQSGIA